EATLDNFAVAIMELTILSRLVLSLELGGLRVDPKRLTAMGQSMGSTLGVVWAGLDPRLRGAGYSGAGGSLIEIALGATEPFPLKPVVEDALGLRAGEQIHEAHPILHAMQSLWDLVDPIAKAAYVALAPRPGLAPKHVFMTAGRMDAYFSPRAQTALAVAL